MKIVAIILLLIIIIALGRALLQMVRGGRPTQMVRALTLRVGLSIALFVLLLVAYGMGWIHPNA
ncbi:twin transmembrane helix small protein [Iodobacter ciconiae]|uniref:Twin transmembrane helix small protein n=1 Tax=Iodobacter ciconiae TaxID=2496266 RepID=A0A3S8ZVI9_9NEIS|nr:twin transmembrane helix small protein [Iodobacter ciconiae]AZN37502.1 twin transmembrane helix small protein [Iodobacter ciconiae]